MTERAPLTVVVPTRNRPEMLRGCLAALRHDLAEHDVLVVVDSASTDRAVPTVAAEYSASYVRDDTPGASRARNAGWRAATTDLVAFVDDDVRVRPGWADAVVACFAGPEVSFVAGRIDVPAGDEVDLPVAVKTDATPDVIDRDTRGVLGASANLALRRDLLVLVGGFDERLGPATWFASAEDLDLLDRVIATGATGRYEPAAAVEHVQWRGRWAKVRLSYGYGKGQGGRLARLSLRDRPRAGALAADIVWGSYIRGLLTSVRNRYEYGALSNLALLAGTLAGFLGGLVRLR